MFPVRIEIVEENLGGAIKSVKEQLRAIPHKGASYGMLRWLSRDGERLALPERGFDVVFNYLGQVRTGQSGLGANAGPVGESVSRDNHATSLVSINGLVVDDALQMRIDWDGAHFASKTVEGFAEAFRLSLEAIISHCISPEAGGLTPSDVALAKVEQATLDRLCAVYPRLVDLYPATPMQAGMLFHALHDPESPAYFEQMRLELRGDVDEAALEWAFAQVVARHPVLRTALVWQNVPQLLQAIMGSVELDWERVDWGNEPVESEETRVSTWLAADRARGFSLDRAPLMRFAWLRLSPNRRLLVWSNHHVLMDGWSLPVVMGEVLRFYSAKRAEDRIALPDVAPYRRYVGWLENRDRAAGIAFWQDKLGDFTEPFRLDLPAPSSTEKGQGEFTIAFDRQKSASLQKFVREHHLTLNTLVQGAWALLLSRYTGRDDVCFGVTVSGRPPQVEGIEQMVGLFINTLPLRVRIDGKSLLIDWLSSLQTSQSLAREHETMPLAEIQRLSGIAAGTTLFDTLLVFENYPMDQSLATLDVGFEMTSVEMFEQTNYPLTAAVIPGDEFRVRLSWDRNRLDEETIHRLAGHLRQLLTSMTADPTRRLSELDMLTAEERHRILVEWNDTARPYPQDMCVHQLFEQQVAKTPDAIAVVFEHQQLSYAELNTRANRLAHHLRSLGVGPEVRVGICLERSTEVVVAILGVLKAGGAYVPLDPSYPADRLRFMAEDAGLRVLVMQSRVPFEVPASMDCMDMGDIEGRLASLPSDNPVAKASSENLAYVIYTSGSTGKPKGTCIPHRSVVNFLLAMTRMPGIADSDVWMAVTTPGFDISVLELMGPLTVGATLVIADTDTARNGETLSQLVRSSRASIMQATPSSWRLMLDSGWSGDPALVALCGGEALPTELAQRLSSRVAQLWNMYGPTEVTVWSTMASIDADTAEVHIGRPLTNLQVYVLDSHGRPAPIGASGELYLSGTGVARGYLGRRALSAERFIPDPFAPPGSRMYRTGDLCRWRADGNLEFLGRIDHQVKIRGFRIELGEIEAALYTHPAVNQCVVIARKDGSSEARLVAYIVGEALPSIAELRAHLATTLPDYMIPAAFVMLKSLPLTPNGKVDRKALPAPEMDRTALAIGYAPPRNATEAALVDIWKTVLGVQEIGVHDNFFELGGSSILTIRVVGLAAQMGLELTPRRLFEAPTIAQLADSLEQSSPTPARCLVRMQPGGVEQPLILLPPLGGTSLAFKPLVDALRPSLPVWAFEDPLFSGHAGPESLDGLVGMWVDELLTVAPDPTRYRLAGYSFGGMLAVEMARQLEARGRRVDVVLNLDGGLPSGDHPFVPLEWVRNGANQLGIAAEIADVDEGIERIAEVFASRVSPAMPAARAWASALLKAAEANHRRSSTWRVREMAVHVVVLRASGNADRGPDLGWSLAVGRPVEVLLVPGDHVSMVQPPFVKTLALCIEASLSRDESK